MSEITIRIYRRVSNKEVEDAVLDFDLSDFGGFLPSIGDTILDPGVVAGKSRSDSNNRQIWTVVGRVFNPRDKQDYVALIVDERAPTGFEQAFVPQ